MPEAWRSSNDCQEFCWPVMQHVLLAVSLLSATENGMDPLYIDVMLMLSRESDGGKETNDLRWYIKVTLMLA